MRLKRLLLLLPVLPLLAQGCGCAPRYSVTWPEGHKGDNLWVCSWPKTETTDRGEVECLLFGPFMRFVIENTPQDKLDQLRLKSEHSL